MVCLGVIISDYQLRWFKSDVVKRRDLKISEVSDQQSSLVRLEEWPLVSLVARRVFDEQQGWSLHHKNKHHHQNCKGECHSEGRLWALSPVLDTLRISYRGRLYSTSRPSSSYLGWRSRYCFPGYRNCVREESGCSISGKFVQKQFVLNNKQSIFE